MLGLKNSLTLSKVTGGGNAEATGKDGDRVWKDAETVFRMRNSKTVGVGFERCSNISIGERKNLPSLISGA
jgi:hypothetical protein